MATVTATTAPATRKTGRFAILEQFLADGMRCMFGNPGTVEQGFLDALSDYPDLRYILTLQESVAVTMAVGGSARPIKFRNASAPEATLLMPAWTWSSSGGMPSAVRCSKSG